jgi:hypothetical protein
MASQLRTDRQGAPLFAVDWSSVRPLPREGGTSGAWRGGHILPRFCRVLSRAADFFGVKERRDHPLPDVNAQQITEWGGHVGWRRRQAYRCPGAAARGGEKIPHALRRLHPPRVIRPQPLRPARPTMRRRAGSGAATG